MVCALQQPPRPSQWASPQKPGTKSPQRPPRTSSRGNGSGAAAFNSLAHAPPHRPQLAAISAGPVSGILYSSSSPLDPTQSKIHMHC